MTVPQSELKKAVMRDSTWSVSGQTTVKEKARDLVPVEVGQA